jgi:NAD+ synthase (glutamine-hydrolysing)
VGTVVGGEGERPWHPALVNAAALLEDGAVRGLWGKGELAADDVNFEPRWFVPAAPALLLELGGRRVRVLISRDLAATTPAAVGGADLAVCLAAWPYHRGVFARRLELLRRLAMPAVLVNACGGSDELIFDGASFAVAGNGELLARLEPFAEQSLVVDLDAAGAALAEPLAAEAELFAALTVGVRDFALKNRVPRLFVGLSGGIDSALVAVLAAAAVGPERVTAVAMPSRYTDERSTACARQLASALGIAFELVPIEPLHVATEELLGSLLAEGTGAENVQARLRSMILMAHVNRYGGLLLNTSNKTELALGYGTSCGDLAGTLCPIADLTKTEVMALARWVEEERGVIPDFVLQRPPTAELAPGQVDPFDYQVVAPAMETLVRGNRSDAAMRRSEAKRWQLGVVLKVSEKAFGTGRLIPITRR